MKKLICAFLFIFMLAGCSAAPQKAIATGSNESVATTAATQTSGPTATSTITPNAVVTYPLLAGTPMPKAGAVITTANINSLREVLTWWENPANSEVLSPDGSLIAVNTTEWVRIYNTATLELVKEFTDFPFIANFSPDNQNLVTTGGSIYTIDGEKVFGISSAGSISYSADLSRVAVVKSCTDVGLVFPACESDIYDVKTNQMINGYPGTDPKLSPDGKYIALVQENFINFREVDTGTMVLELNPDNYLMDQPGWSYSPDSTKVLVVHPGIYNGIRQAANVNILSLADGTLLRTIYPEVVDGDYIRAFISSNGLYLGIADASKIDTYEVKTRKVILTTLLDPDKEFSGMDDNGQPLFSIKAENVFPSEFSVQNIWDLHFGSDASTINFFSRDQYCSILNNTETKCTTRGDFLASDGYFYSVTADAENIILYKLVNGNQEEVTRMNWKYFAYSNISEVHVIGYSVGRQFLVLEFTIGYNSSRVLILDLTKQAIVKSWDWDESRVDYSNMSEDGKFLALKTSGEKFGNDGQLWEEGIFDFEKGWFVWSGGNTDTYLMEISPDSTKLVEIQNRNGVSLFYYYDFIRRELLSYHEMAGCYVTAAAVSMDNSYVLFGCSGSIMAMDLTTGKQITMWSAFNESITTLALSSDNTRIAAGNGSGFIKVWDLGK